MVGVCWEKQLRQEKPVYAQVYRALPHGSRAGTCQTPGLDLPPQHMVQQPLSFQHCVRQQTGVHCSERGTAAGGGSRHRATLVRAGCAQQPLPRALDAAEQRANPVNHELLFAQVQQQVVAFGLWVVHDGMATQQ